MWALYFNSFTGSKKQGFRVGEVKIGTPIQPPVNFPDSSLQNFPTPIHAPDLENSLLQLRIHLNSDFLHLITFQCSLMV